MNCIIIMSLTGSLMTGFVLMFEKLLSGKISNVMLYRMSRIAVVLYLIPLRFIGSFYRSVLREIIHAVNMYFGSPAQTTLSYDQNDWILVQAGHHYYMSTGLRKEHNVALLYFTIVTLFIFFRITQDILAQRRMRKAIARVNCGSEEILQDLQKKMRIKRNIKICKVQRANQTAVVGILRPILICSDELIDDKDKEYIYRHELCHIKRWDVLWSFMAYVSMIVHFINPLAHILYRKMDYLKELSCDETVIRDMNENARIQYAYLLDDMSANKKNKAADMKNHRAASSIIQRRIEMVKKYSERSGKQRRKNRILFHAALFLASLGSLGYQDITSMDVLAQGNGTEEWECIVNYEEAEGTDFEILYDAQYITEDGAIHELSVSDQTNQAMAFCLFHDYQDVTLSYHVRNDSGGCTITVYSAKRCSKCGKVKDSVLLRTINNVVCTH